MQGKKIALLVGPSLAGLIVFGYGCSPSWGQSWGERCTGEGRWVAQNRTIGEFDSIRVGGPIDVQLTPGRAASLRLEAPADVMPRVETRVEGGRLVLQVRGCVNATRDRPIVAHITTRQVREIEMQGSGDVTIQGQIRRDRLDLDLQGSGDVRAAVAVRHLALEIHGSGNAYLSGQTESQDLKVTGSGDVDAARLKARDARVRVSGSGDIDVLVTGELDASVSGSGDIVYRGNPAKVHRRVSGSGSIEGA